MKKMLLNTLFNKAIILLLQSKFGWKSIEKCIFADCFHHASNLNQTALTPRSPLLMYMIEILFYRIFSSLALNCCYWLVASM